MIYPRMIVPRSRRTKGKEREEVMLPELLKALTVALIEELATCRRGTILSVLVKSSIIAKRSATIKSEKKYKDN